MDSVVSAILGASEDVKIAIGDTLDLSQSGFQGYSLTVRDFKIEYYDTLEPRQYKCSLVLTTSTGNSAECEIKVNDPLKFEGIEIYQKSYGWQVNGSISDKAESKVFRLKEGEQLALNSPEKLVLKTIKFSYL